MNDKDIIQLALEHFGAVLKPSDLEVKLAVLAVAAEREACAKACEARKIIDPEYEYDRHYNQGAEHCAFAIRARGEQEKPR